VCQKHALEVIMALSRKLLFLVQCDNWVEAASVEAERQAMLREYFSTMSADLDMEQNKQVVKSLLDHNGTVMSLLSERREHLLRELRSAERGRAAVRAYSGNRE
jgi:hypothetical protein